MIYLRNINAVPIVPVYYYLLLSVFRLVGGISFAIQRLEMLGLVARACSLKGGGAFIKVPEFGERDGAGGVWFGIGIRTRGELGVLIE